MVKGAEKLTPKAAARMAKAASGDQGVPNKEASGEVGLARNASGVPYKLRVQAPYLRRVWGTGGLGEKQKKVWDPRLGT